MQPKHFKRSILAVLAVLSLAVLACNMPATKLGGSPSEPPPTGQSGPPSPGSQSYTLSAVEINAIIAQALQQQPGIPVKSLAVTLDNGQVGAAGQVQQGSIILPVEFTAAVGVDGQGGLVFQISDATLGPFPLPAEYLGEINKLLNESLRQPIADATNNIFIESVAIGDGFATITGRPR